MSIEDFFVFHDKGIFVRGREYYKYSHITNCIYRKEKRPTVGGKTYSTVYISYVGNEVFICEIKEDDGEKASEIVSLILGKRDDYLKGGVAEKLNLDL
jgi:hypothetical protein